MVTYWKIRQRLLRVPGVANVAMWGEQIQMPQVLVDPERVTVKIACGGCLTLDCPDYMVAHARAAVASGEAFRLARALNCVQYLTAYEEKYQGDDQFIGPDWLAGWGIP